MLKKSIKKINTKLYNIYKSISGLYIFNIFQVPWILNNPWQINEKKNKINYIVLNSLIDNCDRLPKQISTLLLNFTDLLSIWSTTFFSTIWNISLNAYIIEGDGKYEETNIKILYVSEGHIDNFFIKLIISDKYTINKVGKVNLWNLRKSIKKIILKFVNIDIIIIKGHMYY